MTRADSTARLGGLIVILLTIIQPFNAADAMPNQLALNSSAFSEGDDIPILHTCEGENSSPPLEWSGVPTGAKSLAIIVDDPDAPDPANPKTTWVHWVVYNIPVSVHELEVGAKELPKEALQGRNDWGQNRYGGPCPPIGRHRYVHKLYALDRVLPDLDHPTKAELEHAMRGHIIAKAQLVGMYQKL